MPTTTWYEVDTVHRNDKYDVDKTGSLIFYTDCIWEPAKLEAALVSIGAQNPDVSNLRVTSLTQIDGIPKNDPRRREAFDLDRRLGI